MELVCHIEQGHHQQSFVGGDMKVFPGESNPILMEDATKFELYHRANLDQNNQQCGIL